MSLAISEEYNFYVLHSSVRFVVLCNVCQISDNDLPASLLKPQASSTDYCFDRLFAHPFRHYVYTSLGSSVRYKSGELMAAI